MEHRDVDRIIEMAPLSVASDSYRYAIPVRWQSL